MDPLARAADAARPIRSQWPAAFVAARAGSANRAISLIAGQTGASVMRRRTLAAVTGSPLQSRRLPMDSPAASSRQPSSIHASSAHAVTRWPRGKNSRMLTMLNVTGAGSSSTSQGVVTPSSVDQYVARSPSRTFAAPKRLLPPRVPLATARRRRRGSSPKVASRMPPESAQRGDVVLVDAAAAVGRHVQQQRGAAADRREVEVEEVLRGLDLVVLGGVVEPAGADRDVALGGHPVRRRRGGPLVPSQ